MSRLNIQSDMSIDELGQIISGYIEDHWKDILSENIEDLKKFFLNMKMPPTACI
ncbi:DUF6022 family protein [Shouchella miscanthi]|uniref:DUF6022 family protein n=1 Tax=Shouchella miscanthi TaxID=2598861 RepID=A0ABU6NPY7_9BACI|nr:DUF6022 family protein [Shouchella miscanthi]